MSDERERAVFGNLSDLGEIDRAIVHPTMIELCGECGRRVFRIGPEQAPYCEKGGHRAEPVQYVRRHL